MIEYPKGLPCALRDGYGFEPVNNISRSEMVSGRARQRIIFDSVPTMVPLSWICSERQALLFEAWAAQVAGAGWFLIPLKVPGGIRAVEVRFTQTPSGPELVGVSGWRFSGKCELRERPILAPGWAELMPGWVLMMNIFDLTMNRHWPLMHFDYPTYAAAMAVIRTLRPGLQITIEADETQGGRHAVYNVVRADSPSLILDFMAQVYKVGQPNDYLVLVRAYGS